MSEFDVESDAGGFSLLTRPAAVSARYSSPHNSLSVHGSVESRPNQRAVVSNNDSVGATRFIERTQYFTERFEYPRDGTDPGIILIFNQDDFYDNIKNPPRRGSIRDVNEIITCMQRLGFNIHENNICWNFTREKILTKLDRVIDNKRDLQQTNCVIVFFLTHGDDFEQLHAYDRTIKTNEIWGKLANCEELENKPKMFIFQACKGDNWATVNGENPQYVENTPSDIVELNTYSAKHMKPDMLVVYSTLEGNFSFRNPVTGSWFIQELCKNFAAYGRRDDVLSLLTRTTKCVCGNYFRDGGDFGIQKQMPVFVSTLTRKFYLNRNKDRAILLQIQQTNNEILKQIVDLKSQVEVLVSRNEEKLRRRR